MKLKPRDLRWVCSPRGLEAEDLGHEITPLAQERAARAIELGLSMVEEGFNIFVVGEEGTGKKRLVLEKARAKAKEMPVPWDWCYVHNFKDPKRPRAMALPPGVGRRFMEDMEAFVGHLKEELPRAFESKQYEEKAKEITEQYNRQKEELLRQLAKMAEIAGFSLKYTPTGIALFPLMGGQLIKEEKLLEDPRLREFVDSKRREIEPIVSDYLKRIREIDKKLFQEIKRLREEVALFVLNSFLEDLYAKYRKYPEIEEHLHQVKEDILKHIDLFLQLQSSSENPFLSLQIEKNLAKYTVNVVVDNSHLKCAPLIYEKNPTYSNLFGKIGLRAEFGMYVADFTQIVPGSIHRANGGILVLNLRDVLVNPGVWPTLKKALKYREITVQPYLEELGLSHPVSSLVKPEPIPLKLQVILLGDPFLVNLLFSLDPEARRLFKVRAEFVDRVKNTPRARKAFSLTVKSIAKEKGLLPFSPDAVARLLEYSSRLAQDKEKLSLKIEKLADVMAEASHYAKREGEKAVGSRHVERTLKERVFRWNLVEERLLELIEEGVLVVEPEGERVGQTYGLSVVDFEEFSLGRPVRITASAFVGTKGIVSIEREAELSGKIFNKAVFTLAGYMGNRYGGTRPLALSASISFEQSYSHIEGDSASLAELLALLSAVSQVPLKQGVAFTGSVDQHGRVQAVGGINEKVEGFHKVCRLLGVKGTVVIPSSNVRHLQLDPEVVRSVRKGNFEVEAVSSVDEAIEIASGMKAEEFHKRVAQRLDEFYRISRRRKG